MDIWVWISLVGSLFATLTPITGGVRRVNERQLAKYARARGLPLPPALRPEVVERIRRRERSALIGALAGLAVAAAAVTLLHLFHAGVGSLGSLLMGGVAFGASLGGFLAIMGRSDGRAADAPRVARPVQTTTSDYLTPGERRGFRLVPVSIGMGLVTTWVVWTVVPTHRPGHWLLVVLASVVSVLLGAGWLLMARASAVLVERAQFARDDLELAWDDAERTQALRGLVDNGIVAGLVAPLVSLVLAGSLVVPREVRVGAEQLTMTLGLVALGVGLVAWALVLVPYLAGRFSPNPWRQLWPGTAFAGVA